MLENNVSLLLYGPHATGKTYSAICVCNEYIGQLKSVKFVSSLSYTSSISGRTSRERDIFIDPFLSASLLVLDNLGGEKPTAVSHLAIVELLEFRVFAGRPTIITSRLNIDELTDSPILEYRMLSDIISQTTLCLSFSHDYGTKVRNDNIKKVRGILNEKS